MSLTPAQIEEVKQAAAKFMYNNRPPEDIRPKLVGYRIDGQSVYVFEIRPQWDKPEIIQEYDVAKTTYIKSKSYWKTFWLRANLKWYLYPPRPYVKNISEFFDEVENEPAACFFG